MKARFFTANNIQRLSLSPYVDFLPEGKCLVFRNDLFRQVVITPPLLVEASEFIERLREGMSEEEMLIYLGESFNSGNPGEIMTGLMQKGILE